MNGCGFCGAVPSEQAPICPTYWKGFDDLRCEKQAGY